MTLMMFMTAHAVNDGFSWIIPPLLPAIREHFHLSYSEMGAFYSSYQFFGNIMQAPAAYLVYFAPLSTIIVSGLVWVSAWLFLASFSSSYGILVGASAVSGIGRATYHPLAATAISRIFGRESLGRAIAFHMSGSSIGQVVGPFLVGMLLSFGWRLPIQVWSVLGLLAGLCLFLYLRNQKEALHTENKALRLPFFSLPLGIYLVAISIWGIAQTGLMTFLPLFLVDYRDFSAQKAAAVYGVMALSGAIFRPFFGTLMDRMGRRKPVIIGGFVISALSILLLTTFRDPWIFYLSIILLGTFGSGHSGLSDTFMIELIPSSRREETLGVIFTVRQGLAALAPFIVGLFSERFHLSGTFLVLALVPLITASILCLAEEKPIKPAG
jgi:FSR family fosmidomycin resistance protein-like MFS transporter